MVVARSGLRSLGVVLVASCAWLTAVSAAEAHGGIPRAFEFLENEARPGQLVMRSDVWGFFHSSDGGKHWQWSCSNVYGTAALLTEHVEMAFTKTGRLLVSNSFEGLRYTDDFCNWSRAEGFVLPSNVDSAPLLKDVVVLPDGTVLALTSNGTDEGLLNLFWVSHDDGATFTISGDLKRPDDAYSSVGLSREGNRIYVLGQAMGTSQTVLLRTDDGGGTYQRLDGPPLSNPSMKQRIQAVHPNNPDLVFVWLDLIEEEKQDLPDEVWFTSDAGNTWRPLVKSDGDLPGFAFSPDGDRVAVAGTREGVRSGSIQDVLDGRELPKVNSLQTWGLLWNDAGLHAGKDNFAPRGTPETFTVGISQDEGKTFEESVSICDFQFSHCAAGTAGHDMCEPFWNPPEDRAGAFVIDYKVNSGRCESEPDAGAGNSSDAGASPAPKDDPGCSCSTPGTSAPGAAALALAVSAMGLRLLRRRSPAARSRDG